MVVARSCVRVTCVQSSTSWDDGSSKRLANPMAARRRVLAPGGPYGFVGLAVHARGGAEGSIDDSCVVPSRCGAFRDVTPMQMTTSRPWKTTVLALAVVAACDAKADKAGSDEPAAAKSTPNDGKTAKAAPESAETPAGDSPAPAPAPSRAAMTPEDVATALKIEGANLSMGDAESDGQRIADLSCAGVERPMLGGLAILGSIAKQKASLDACAPEGDAAVVSFVAKAGKLTDLKVQGTASDEVDGCIASALQPVTSPFDATCAAILLFGAAEGADAAKAKLTGK